METSLLLSFSAKNDKMAKLPQNFWRKFPLFVFSKKTLQTPPYFGGACRHQSVSQSVCVLATILMILYKKCRQLRRNLSESVWGYSPVLLQYKKEKTKDCWRASRGRLSQISPGWRYYFKELLKLKPVDINVATAGRPGPPAPPPPPPPQKKKILFNLK